MSLNQTNSGGKPHIHMKSSYRSTISPRSSSMSRNKMLCTNANRMIPMNYQQSSNQNVSGLASSLPFSIVAPTKSISGTSVREYREKERKELCELNDRFASYVERVRFLEVQNKQLRNETESMKSRLGTNDTKIKDMYETELRQARDVINTTSKDQMLLEARAQKAEDDATFYRERYDDLLTSHQYELDKLKAMAKEMSENESAINLMNRRMKDLDDELTRYKTESQKLLLEVQRITSELYSETSTRLQFQNDKQSLEEELNFLKQIHAQELEDLQQYTSQDMSLDPSNFFKHELANAIKDIRDEYETLNQQQKNEMENWYRLKVTNAIQELQTKRLVDLGGQKPRDDEIKVLHEQVTTFRRDNTITKQKNHELECKIDELESIIRRERDDNQRTFENQDSTIMDLKMKLDDLLGEYEDLLSNNSNLNSEISVYRKLLEGSDDNEGLRHVVENVEYRARKDWDERHAVPDTVKVVTFQTEMTGNDLKDSDTKDEINEESSSSVDNKSPSKDMRITDNSYLSESALNKIDDIGDDTADDTADDTPKSIISLGFSNNQIKDNIKSDDVTSNDNIKQDESEASNSTEADNSYSIHKLVSGWNAQPGLNDSDQPKESNLSESKIYDTLEPTCGELLVDISYDFRGRSLAFVVKKAKNIKASAGSLFVRCTLMPDKLKQKSHSVQSMPSPVWNTLFEFDCPSISACRVRTVYFTVKHMISSYTGDKFTTIGRVKLSIADFDLESGEIDRWLDLTPNAADQIFSDSSEGGHGN